MGRRERGFSFAELMLTMLILASMTAMTAAGIPVVMRLYQRAVDTANAETYLNTTLMALRGRLCVSKPVLDNVGNVLYCEHPQSGYYYFSNSAEGIQVVEYLDIDRLNPLEQPLTPGEPGEFISSYDDTKKIRYDDTGFFTIEGLQVEKQGTILAKLDTPYVIHTLNP